MGKSLFGKRITKQNRWVLGRVWHGTRALSAGKADVTAIPQASATASNICNSKAKHGLLTPSPSTPWHLLKSARNPCQGEPMLEGWEHLFPIMSKVRNVVLWFKREANWLVHLVEHQSEAKREDYGAVKRCGWISHVCSNEKLISKGYTTWHWLCDIPDEETDGWRPGLWRMERLNWWAARVSLRHGII